MLIIQAETLSAKLQCRPKMQCKGKVPKIRVARPDAEIAFCKETGILYFEARCGKLGTALLGKLCCPGELLFLELSAHVPESAKRPDASPDERCGPTDDIAGLSVDGENQDGTESGHRHGANAPEKTEAAQHGAEDVASFVATVQGFAVCSASAAVNTNYVFDHGVDAGAELGAFGNAGDAAWGADLEVAANVYQEEFHGEGVEHGWYWHSDETERWVFTDGATAKSC